VFILSGAFRRLLPVALILASTGCVTAPPVYIATEVQPFHRIAVLPLSNEATDLDGPIFIRKLIQEGLSRRGANLVPLDEIDAKLKDNGFTDGGQLRAAQPADMGQWLGADTLLYTTVVDFGYINIGFYWQRKVKVLGRLVDAKTGTRLWETERGITTRWIVTDKEHAKREFVTQLAVQAAEKLAHQPLGPESRRTVDLLLDTIPYR
jgi:hypothetical protein